MRFFISIFLAAVTLLAVSLLRTYRSVPIKELKRRARTNDPLAQLMFRAASYGSSLQALLWLLVGLTGSIFFLYVARLTDTWFAFALSLIVIWLGFLWLPASEATKIGTWLAAQVAPVFAWPLQYLHPLLDRAIRYIQRLRPIRFHTGLYDKEDLVELIDRQEVQADNRIERAELEIARHSLVFGDKNAKDILTPRRVVKVVSAEESVGPVLMSELHNSGFSRFPVFEGKKDNFVGTLYLRDLVDAKAGGSVRKLFRPKVYYIHEEQPLMDALQAILKTHHHQFIVVNSFEEFVGVITIEDVLEQIVGQPIIDEFDRYESMRESAAYEARKEHRSH